MRTMLVRASIVVTAVAATAVTGVFGASATLADKPALEPMYANDSTVFMSAPSEALAKGSVNTAQDFYLIQYPTLPTNGQSPLCNHSCPSPPFVPPVHDVVLEGAPGFGANGTAGAFNPHWHVLALVYSPRWVTSPNFAPAQSAAEVDAGEAAGHFLPINNAGGNPFEVDTGVLFLCVLVSSHA